MLVIRSGRSLRPAALGVALVFALAACSGPSAPATPAALATPVPSGVIALQAKEYAFTPAAASAPAGAVTFSVTNAGTENHEFEVLAGDQSLGKIEAFARSTTQSLTVSLEAGTYTFICRLNGHDQLGMRGTLTVTGG